MLAYIDNLDDFDNKCQYHEIFEDTPYLTDN